jgi:hypothetical protein
VHLDKSILDVCCGSRMFWFDKNNKDVLFGDIRTEEHTLCDGRSLEIKPDMQLDFTNIDFQSNHFKSVGWPKSMVYLTTLGKMILEKALASALGCLKTMVC